MFGPEDTQPGVSLQCMDYSIPAMPQRSWSTWGKSGLRLRVWEIITRQESDAVGLYGLVLCPMVVDQSRGTICRLVKLL